MDITQVLPATLPTSWVLYAFVALFGLVASWKVWSLLATRITTGVLVSLLLATTGITGSAWGVGDLVGNWHKPDNSFTQDQILEQLAELEELDESKIHQIAAHARNRNSQVVIVVNDAKKVQGAFLVSNKLLDENPNIQAILASSKKNPDVKAGSVNTADLSLGNRFAIVGFGLSILVAALVVGLQKPKAAVAVK